MTLQYPLQAQARHVLQQYGVQAALLALIGTSDSTVYRVTTPDDNVFTLRFHAAARHPRQSLVAELVWLAHLDRVDPGLAPKPVPSESGEWTVPVGDPHQAEVWATLLTWTEGQTLGVLNLTQAAQAGALLARLHRHAETFRPPADFERPTYDLAHYRRRWGALRDLSGPDTLTGEQVAIVDTSWPTFSKLLSSSKDVPGGFGLVHGDAHPGNFVGHGGELHIIDFGRLGWAPYLLDVADCTLDMEEAERAAFITGYRQVRDLPEGYDAHFRALMYLSVLDNLAFLARYPHEWEGVLATLGQVLEAIARLTAGVTGLTSNVNRGVAQ